MQLRELKEIIANSGDAAFAVDDVGTIVAWNAAAEELFGLSHAQAAGRFCCDLMRGADETGVVCEPQCAVQQAIRRGDPVSNYELEVQTAAGRQWCSATVLGVNVDSSTRPYSIHIWRSIDLAKRFDLLLRDVVVRATGLPADAVRKAVSRGRTAAHAVRLSTRELEVLRLLATGASTKEMASTLGITSTTVNNHVSHILEKLDAHSRLEAVRRAELAGLI